jgi:hypothetical protein
MKSIFTLLALSIILASCGTSNTVTSNHFLQKRKYTSGWHFNHSIKGLSSHEESINDVANLESSINSIIKVEEPLILENTTSIEESECDTIMLKNGQIVRVNIINTTDTTIRYTACDSDDQTELIMAKENVKALQYANGNFEFIRKAPIKKSEKVLTPVKYRTLLVFAIQSLVLAAVSLVCVLAALAGIGEFIILFTVLAALFVILCIVFTVVYHNAKDKYEEYKKARLNNPDLNKK